MKTKWKHFRIYFYFFQVFAKVKKKKQNTKTWYNKNVLQNIVVVVRQ